MAIYPNGDAPQSPQQASTTQPIDIEAWTEHATAAMSSVTISVPEGVVQSSTVTLQIPLDEHPAPREAPATAAKTGISTTYYKRKEPLRRHSMKSREALLKGKEGSRRRQRWENGKSSHVFSTSQCHADRP